MSKLTVLNAGQNYFVGGGSDKCLIELGGLLENQGHKVIPFAAKHGRNLSTPFAEYFPDRVDFTSPGAGDLLRYIYSADAKRALERLLNDHAVDIAHLHIYYGQLTGSILPLLRERGIPIVQTLHEYKVVCPVYALYAHGEVCERCEGHKFWKATARRCNRGSLARSALSTTEAYVTRWLGSIRNVDHFIAVSRFVKDKVVSLGVPEDKVSVVHNFVDPTQFTPSHKGGEHFLYFGRLDRPKGVFTLLEAAGRLPDKIFYFAGEGAAREALEAEAAARGYDNVRFLGFQSGEDLHRLIRKSICAVMPSEVYETFGLSAAEAMALGRPVLASRIGGLAEVIEDGVDGYLVPPGDPGALAERLRWFSENNDRAVEMGRAARENVTRKFNGKLHYEKTMAIYDRVLAAKGR